MFDPRKDLQHELMRRLPKVKEFSDEEVETMSGKASQLFDVSRGKLPRYTLTSGT